MSIARYRVLGPVLHPKHRIGGAYVWDGARKEFRLTVTSYCNSSNTQWWLKRKECWDETHPGPPWKSGGPLFIREWDNPTFHTKAGVYTSPNGFYQYRGSFFHIHPFQSTDYGALGEMSDLGTTYGATGWNRFRPAKSGADVGQFVAELRDFASLFRIRVRSFKDLGSSYLSFNFGWRPFLNDIYKFYKSMQKVEKTIAFIRKNNNRWLTRGGTIKQDTETGPEEVLPCRVSPQLNTYYHGTYPITASPTKRIWVTSERVWFKARMKYYIPGLSVDKAEDMTSPLLQRIYGTRITPALLWELTPWSWLVDWFGNVGDVLANISSSSYDNLTAKYAYVMRSWDKVTFLNTEYKFSSREGNSPIKLSSSYVLRTKQRAEASPFGFHLDWGDLSPYQLSILAALGLSRFA